MARWVLKVASVDRWWRLGLDVLKVAAADRWRSRDSWR